MAHILKIVYILGIVRMYYNAICQDLCVIGTLLATTCTISDGSKTMNLQALTRIETGDYEHSSDCELSS